ncbi:extended synaptotagmin-like protein [Perkinsus olseni]|uniref:Extended synaptotagmin-like protein n=1 Tax=Perkinsus olseni TaxID=32597 RepID=A0A7J6LWG9_PEROL|nr:extended synaptotagmin-like protein [Perkinsus olseni]
MKSTSSATTEGATGNNDGSKKDELLRLSTRDFQGIALDRWVENNDNFCNHCRGRIGKLRRVRGRWSHETAGSPVKYSQSSNGGNDLRAYRCAKCGNIVCRNCLQTGRFIGTKICKRCFNGQEISNSKLLDSRSFSAASGSLASAPAQESKPLPASGVSSSSESPSTAVTDVPAVQQSAAVSSYQPRRMPTIWRKARVMSDGQRYIDPHNPTVHFGWDLYALLNVRVIEARGLRAADTNVFGRKSSSDPYCVLWVNKDKITRRTPFLKHTLQPVWDYRCSTMVLKTPGQMLHVEVFDRDVASSDDVIGNGDLDLSTLRRDEPVDGWVPLRYQGKPAGAVRLEVEFSYTVASEVSAYMQHYMLMESQPKDKPKFDVNALYGPGMYILETLWTDQLKGLLMGFVYPIFRWDSWWQSLLVWAAYLYACCFVEYWPAGLCWGVAVVMVRNKMMSAYKKVVDQESNINRHGSMAFVSLDQDGDDGDDDDDAEKSINALVRRFTQLSPTWLKDTAARFQRPLRILADSLDLGEDILMWRDPLSKPVFYILLVSGLVLCRLPFGMVMAIIGSAVMMLHSPLRGLLSGISASVHRSLLGAKAWMNSQNSLLPHCDISHCSDDYRQLVIRRLAKDARRVQTSSSLSQLSQHDPGAAQ